MVHDVANVEIARRTAALLGTGIELRSQPRRGSCFSIALPLVEAGPAPLFEAVIRRQPVPSAGTTVLIVDDDAAIRHATAALLATWHCRSLAAPSAVVAFELAVDAERAIVDLDLGGEEDGIALISRMKAAHPSLICALMTADRSGEVAARCTGLAITLLAKPVDPATLADWLANDGVLSTG